MNIMEISRSLNIISDVRGTSISFCIHITNYLDDDDV